jgi:hypothetical protein
LFHVYLIPILVSFDCHVNSFPIPLIPLPPCFYILSSFVLLQFNPFIQFQFQVFFVIPFKFHCCYTYFSNSIQFPLLLSRNCSNPLSFYDLVPYCSFIFHRLCYIVEFQFIQSILHCCRVESIHSIITVSHDLALIRLLAVHVCYCPYIFIAVGYCSAPIAILIASCINSNCPYVFIVAVSLFSSPISVAKIDSNRGNHFRLKFPSLTMMCLELPFISSCPLITELVSPSTSMVRN